MATVGWKTFQGILTYTEDKVQSVTQAWCQPHHVVRGVRCGLWTVARSDSMRSRHADNLIGADISHLSPDTRHGGTESEKY